MGGASSAALNPSRRAATMIIKTNADIPSSEITREEDYVNRRQFIARAGLMGAGLVGVGGAIEPLRALGNRIGRQDESPNSWEEITSYNNFYEFGGSKSDPA